MKQDMKLHHVGYVTKDIVPIASAYIARYGYELVTAVIHDPVQTANVQFLRLPEDQVYLELISPDGLESKLVGAIKRRAALNHLCYTTVRLEEAVDHLEQEGMRLISELCAGVAFGRRRICWLLGDDMLPIELVEQLSNGDSCTPGEES